MSDPKRELLDAMTKIWRKRGCPSSRVMAREMGDISHSTAHAAINGPALPSWPTLARVITYLHGDPQDYWALWVVAQTGRDPGSAMPPTKALASGAHLEGYRVIAEAIREGLGDIAAAIREQNKVE